MGQDATPQIVVEFTLHVGRKAFGIGVVVERSEKGFEMLCDYLIEHCAAWIAGFVGVTAGPMSAPYAQY